MKMTQMLMLAVITLFYASAGLAGNSIDGPVQVNLDEKFAQGVQTTARFSNNDVEAIGCGARVTDDGVNSVAYFGFCQATDANGVNVVCATFSPDLVDAINSVANYGFLLFTWNDNNECLSVRNSTQSVYIPDFKKEKQK
jgi:hypothetical protein